MIIKEKKKKKGSKTALATTVPNSRLVRSDINFAYVRNSPVSERVVIVRYHNVHNVRRRRMAVDYLSMSRVFVVVKVNAFMRRV